MFGERTFKCSSNDTFELITTSNLDPTTRRVFLESILNTTTGLTQTSPVTIEKIN